MHQAVLMHADVHKSPKIHHVAYRALQLHAGGQILDSHHVGAQQRREKLLTGITAGPEQLVHHIPQGGLPYSQSAGQGGPTGILHRPDETLPLLRRQGARRRALAQSAQGKQLPGSRMHGGAVQIIPALRHPQKARTLLKSPGPQLGHLFQLTPGGKGAVLLPVGDNVLRHGGADSGHPGQQWRGSGIQIHPYPVDTAFHHAVQRLRQPVLGHIVLILPHADGLGINLDQLGQRVLQPPGDGNSGPEIDIVIGEFLGRQRRSGVDGGPGFTDHQIGQAVPQLPDYLSGEFFGFPGCGAVADSQHLYAVAADPLGHLPFGLLDFFKGRCRVDDTGIQHPTGGIHHRALASVAVAGIQSQGHLPPHRRLHQKLAQVLGKYPDGRLRGPVGQCAARLPFQGGKQQARPRILARLPDKGGIGRGRLHVGNSEQGQRTPLITHHTNAELLFPFSPVHRQHAVAGDFFQHLPVVSVGRIHPRILVRRLGGQFTGGGQKGPQPCPAGGVVRNPLCQNIPGSLKGGFLRLHPLFRIPVRRGQDLRRRTGGRLGIQCIRQRLQSPFLRLGSASAALGPVGTIQVFQLRQGHRPVQGFRQLLVEHLLFFQRGADFFLLLL